MDKRLVSVIILVILVIVLYYLPSQIVDLDKIDMAKVPYDYYKFHTLFMTCAFFMMVMYSGYLFSFTRVEEYKTKILLLWLFINEIATFIDYVARNYLMHKTHSYLQMIIMFCAISIGFHWIIKSAFYWVKSDVFHIRKTYIVIFLPKDIFGIINWIFNHAGHKAVLQNGIMYKFGKFSGEVEPSIITSDFPSRKDIRLKEIRHIPEIGKLVGKKFKIFKYNCNRMVKDAQQGLETS